MPISIDVKSKGKPDAIAKRIQDILDKVKQINILAWEAANEIFEDRIVKNFIKNANSLNSSLDDDYKKWKKKSVGNNFLRSEGGESRTAKQEFVNKYARHTGYLLEKISQHYPIGTKSKFFTKTLVDSSNVENARLRINFNVDSFKASYPKRLFDSIMSTKGGLALISLTPRDVQTMQEVLIKKIAENIRKRKR